MTLFNNLPKATFEYREGPIVVLWFKRDPDLNEYVTDIGERLGPSYPRAAELAKSKAVARTMKPARVKERFK